METEKIIVNQQYPDWIQAILAKGMSQKDTTSEIMNKGLGLGMSLNEIFQFIIAIYGISIAFSLFGNLGGVGGFFGGNSKATTAAIEKAENANVLLLDDAAISDLIDALESAQEDLVNVAELKDILAELKAMDPADYTEESAYMIAEVIYYFEDLIETATDVEEVEFVLEQFEAVEFVYIADLKASLAEAVAIVKDDCKTEESWNELVKAIAFAYNVLDNAQSQATVDATVAYLDVAVLATAKDADTSILDAIESLEGILGEMGDTLSDMDLEAIEDAIADLSAKLDALTTKVEESGCASSMGSEYIVLAIVALLGAAVLVAKKAKSKNN